MSDPLDQTTPQAPTNPPASTDAVLNDPQAMVNDALGTSTPPTTEAVTAPSEPMNTGETVVAPVVPTPTSDTTSASSPLPPLEPLAPLPSSTPTTEPVMSSPPADPVPSAEPVTSSPSVSTVPMGDDAPLAFAGAAASTSADEPAAVIPPAPMPEAPKPKKKSKVMLVVVGIFALMAALGGGGFYAYQQFGVGDSGQIAKLDSNGVECPSGHHVNAKGVCMINDAKGGDDKDREAHEARAVDGLGKSACQTSGSGGQWCEGNSNGKSYGFCMKNDGSQGTCVKQAIAKGYTVSIGAVDIRCQKVNPACTGTCAYEVAEDQQDLYDPYPGSLAKANQLCTDGAGTINFGTGKFICKVGVKGYTGSGACTATNGVAFNGNMGCFCGTVQVDTGNGHQSYSSTCGCDEKTPPPSAPPAKHYACNTTTYACELVSGAGANTCTTNEDCVEETPEMACTGITRLPVKEPVEVGDSLTFTCAGTVTPPSAGALTYKFRYSLNAGAVTALANKTPTTTELTINACGTYKVQCQACATLNGVLTCDPTWTGATQ